MKVSGVGCQVSKAVNSDMKIHQIKVSYSMKWADFQAGGWSETRHPTPDTYINYRPV